MKPISRPGLFLYSIILLLPAGCATHKASQHNADKPPLITTNSADSFDDTNDPLKYMQERFLVTAIDSTEKLYLIYARHTRDSAVYKIVSQKINPECRDVQIGNAYPFILRSLLAPFTIGDASIDIRLMPHVSISVFDSHVEQEPGKVKDIVVAFNLSGLCLTDKNKLLQLRQPKHQP